MALNETQISELQKPLDKKHVKEREAGRGKMLSYIEGWHAIAEANRIFGHDGWDSCTEMLQQLGEPYQTDKKDRNGGATGAKVWRVAWMAKVRITVQMTVREGIGFGSGIDADLGSAHESAIKEAETDARKRALMTFGWPFGLALYDKAREHVADENGASEQKPSTSASRPSAPAPAPRASGTLVWADEDGVTQAFDKPRHWFEHALKSLRSARNPAVLWGINGKVADDIVASAEPSWRARAEADREACLAAIHDANPLAA